MLIVGIPMYICATASTPLAAALLAGGVSPGAVVVFLLASPATNVSTFGIIRKELGNAAAWVVLGGLVGSALLTGIAIDAIATALSIDVAAQATHAHEHGPGWFAYVCTFILIALAVYIRLPKNMGKTSVASDKTTTASTVG